MLVDDEPAIIRILEKYLASLGYQTLSCDNGRTALDAYLVDAGRFDLVVTDQTMPNMAGDMLIRGVREINPSQNIVLCTGFSETFPQSEAEKLGENQYLRKPFTQIELATCVRRIMDNRP